LQTPGTGNYTFSFTDIMGRNVLQGELQMAQIQTIDIAALTPGMYVITLLEQDSQIPVFTRIIIE
jgi:hypothetical protein